MKLRNMFCKGSILAVILMINTSAFAQDKQGITISERNSLTNDWYIKTEDSSDLPLITIKRATGEVEAYGYHDLFNEEPTSIDINEVEKVDTMKPTNFTWGISANSNVYSNEQLNLNPNDKIIYNIVPLLGDADFKVGLRNNVDGTFNWVNEHYNIPELYYVNGSFTTAVSGNFSFAIYNASDIGNSFMGGYYKN